MNLNRTSMLNDAKQMVTRSQPSQVNVKRIAAYVILVLLVVLMLLPFAWMLSTSLKAQQYILETPPRLIPNPLTFESYT